MILFFAWSIVKLYEATSTPALQPTKTPTVPVEVKPAVPGKLKSTKQPVPDIFADLHSLPATEDHGQLTFCMDITGFLLYKNRL